MSHFLKSLLFALAGGAMVMLIVYFFGLRLVSQRQQHKFVAEYVISFPNKGSNSQAGGPLRVIEERLKYSRHDHEVSQDAAGNYILTVQNIEDTALLDKLITNSGRLYFQEVYSLQQLADAFATADSLLQPKHVKATPPPPSDDTVGLPVPVINDSLVAIEHRLLSLMNFQGGSFEFGAAPFLAFVATKDSAALMKLLHNDTVRSLLPADAYFVFEREAERGLVRLFAPRRSSDSGALNENNITRAELRLKGKDPNNTELFIQFDEKGKSAWADLTRRKKGEPLAIILDDYLISVPIVYEEITGGQAVLSRMPIPGARYLEGMLNGGRLPEPPVIISKMAGPAAAGRMPTLPVLLAGILAMGLIFTVYFILARPKKNT